MQTDGYAAPFLMMKQEARASRKMNEKHMPPEIWNGWTEGLYALNALLLLLVWHTLDGQPGICNSRRMNRGARIRVVDIMI